MTRDGKRERGFVVLIFNTARKMSNVLYCLSRQEKTSKKENSPVVNFIYM